MSSKEFSTEQPIYFPEDESSKTYRSFYDKALSRELTSLDAHELGDKFDKLAPQSEMVQLADSLYADEAALNARKAEQYRQTKGF